MTKRGEKTCLLNDAVSERPRETRPIRRAINLISIGFVLLFFRIASFVTSSPRRREVQSAIGVECTELGNFTSPRLREPAQAVRESQDEIHTTSALCITLETPSVR